MKFGTEVPGLSCCLYRKDDWVYEAAFMVNVLPHDSIRLFLLDDDDISKLK
ncbi:uncharacterized protein PHALS_13486 [Plasmopara halstedii]|uniref:Uncharacterized protein n=1 Tax=Plasmopara halstedii TaxID=4781 RepID=A0A0P1APS2_PLAHL|nr:uncharacterized protein PHALS_13486 [Plasmopara halstedii]CEG43282.1 hypothetical protein PHALS_13486 [Plasmopara halstedii]|eukprot:XP_024579651.1 hypothetical protein PHALS_13486 [Plasmopara halstedii]